MQLPDTVNVPGGGATAFLDSFLRGNRDDNERKPDGSVLEALRPHERSIRHGAHRGHRGRRQPAHCGQPRQTGRRFRGRAIPLPFCRAIRARRRGPPPWGPCGSPASVPRPRATWCGRSITKWIFCSTTEAPPMHGQDPFRPLREPLPAPAQEFFQPPALDNGGSSSSCWAPG